MSQTQFTESEALLLAIEDAELDSGNTDLDAYLRENFLPNELLALSKAAKLLSDRAKAIYGCQSWGHQYGECSCFNEVKEEK